MTVDPITHFIAGGLAGAAGTTITCPLEVVKTRLQSTVGQNVVRMYRFLPEPATVSAQLHARTAAVLPRPMFYLRHVLVTEGMQALFKGLAPSLFGIIPTRALYFTAYSQFKQHYNRWLSYESSLVHLCSAVSAGVVTTTFTSPIWVVKTQVQLESRPGRRLGVQRCIKQIYKLDGIRGFYRGLSASYAGTAETAIHFVIYEHIKKVVTARRGSQLELTDCMWAAALAKLIASSMCYPHEVCRTRLRQKASPTERRYHSFFQTLLTIWREEGPKGLYGGMSAHLLRVVPNTAIVFFTYEAVVRLTNSYGH